MFLRCIPRWFTIMPGALLLSGCAGLGGRESPATPSSAVAASRAHELPPEKTVELCLATAAELDKQGFDNEAIPQYEKARQLAPQRAAWVARRLAVLYDRQGDSTRALAEFDRALQLDPRNVDLLNDRGFFHYRRGELDEAERWLRQALAVNPRHQQATLNLAQVVGRQGRYEESLRLFGQVVTPAQAQFNLAVLHVKAGRGAEAETCLQRAVQFDPNLAQARALLVRLQTPAPAQARIETSSPLAAPSPTPTVEPRSITTDAPERKGDQGIVQVKMIEDQPTTVALPPIRRPE